MNNDEWYQNMSTAEMHISTNTRPTLIHCRSCENMKVHVKHD